MHEASADQFPNASPRGVLGIAAFGVSMKNENQLVHREPGRMFVEEEKQDGALSPPVFRRGR